MEELRQNKSLAILLVMLTLGTVWAIRGSFGHEYGAAWAGAVGVMVLILVSGRKDWYQNWPDIAAMGAIGWGVTGMISYGRVVGYGRSFDFINTSYGLLSLLVIGGLFGFLGGGLTGLMLESSKKKKIQWASLVTQMVAGAWIFWGYLIYQLQWYMTPPRSELWAACLGASAALAWYMRRNGFKNAWYVAFSTMLGAGFGFSFGNFLQVLGNVSGIAFNWWNAMEYSIGFWGGLGMAYGVFSREWDEMRPLPGSAHNWSIVFLFVIIPLITIVKAFSPEQIAELGRQLQVSNLETFQIIQWALVLAVSVAALIIITGQFKKLRSGEHSQRQMLIVLFTTWIWYKLLQVILSGILYEYHFSSDDLAVLNIVAVAVLYRVFKIQSPFSKTLSDQTFSSALIRTGVGIGFIIFLLAAIAIQTHDGLPGQQQRFDFTTEQPN